MTLRSWLWLVGIRGQIAPEGTPSCRKHCAQDSGGCPIVHQKRGHPGIFEVGNGKDQAKRSEDIPKAESSENQLLREAPHKRFRSYWITGNY